MRALLIKLNTMLLGLVPGDLSLLGDGPFLNSSAAGYSLPEEPVPSCTVQSLQRARVEASVAV